jgi:hypothetical protein
MSEQTNPKDAPKGAPVPRDDNHFKRLFSNSPAKIPEGFAAPLDDRTTAEMMHDRDFGEKASET